MYIRCLSHIKYNFPTELCNIGERCFNKKEKSYWWAELKIWRDLMTCLKSEHSNRVCQPLLSPTGLSRSLLRVPGTQKLPELGRRSTGASLADLSPVWRVQTHSANQYRHSYDPPLFLKRPHYLGAEMHHQDVEMILENSFEDNRRK